MVPQHVDCRLARRRTDRRLPAERRRTHRAAADTPVRGHRHGVDGHRGARRWRAPGGAGPDVRGAAAEPAVSHPDGLADHDHHRRGDDGPGLADAGPLHAGQQADDAQPAGPHTAAVGICRCSSRRRCTAGTSTPIWRRARSRSTASTRTKWARPPDSASTMCSRCRCRTCGARRRHHTARCSCGSAAAFPALTGENIVEAVLFHRLVVLVGVGLIVWATPRLARRCGVAEVSALWLGAANPLLFMHLVAGIHNEALMLGLMLAGTEFALRGVGRRRPAAAAAAGLAARPRRVGALVSAGHAATGHRADHVVLAGEAAVAAGARLRRDGPGTPLGRHVQGVPGRRRIADRGVAGGDGA